ncbi:MAG TPA: winged helix-turn-helix domain-containing protein [Lacipirellulaceae bacterium]|nr:winged helix-turn-helix domain-containing protein [Lacipirellulaceae bacterium]
MDRNEVRFSRFRLDLSLRQLVRDEIPVPLGSRALDILCVLASAKGEMVSKEELMTRVWPGVVVEENTIQVHVSALRKALDGGKGCPTHLVTVPGRGYRLVGLELSDSASANGADSSLDSARPDKPSIAVLPFQNMSGDPEQEYFADGMVEEIITGLSRIKWLSVISRNSTFIYKNKPATITEVSEKFGVRYVLEGGVRKSQNRIRITAQLIDSETDAHLWAQHYDRVLEDVFALQDEITMCVVGAIEPSLRKAEIDRIRRKRPNNLNAYDLVLRSLPFALSHVPKESAKAIPLLEDALTLQPDYAAAHAFLSRCLHHRYARAGLHEEDRIAAIQHAHAAIAHGSDDATAISVAAYIIALDEHDTAAALKLFEVALELSSSNAFALNFSAVILAWMGKVDLAMQRAQMALRLSPFDIYNFRSSFALAITHFYKKRYPEALGAAASSVHANPSFSIGHAILAAALFRVGRAADAKTAAQNALEHEPTFTIHGFSRIAAFEPAVFEPLAAAWREIGLPE